LEQIFYGYFENAQDKAPAHEPPRDCPCLYCGKPVTAQDVRSHNLMFSSRTYAQRSYFYWTHRTCDEAHGPSHKDGGPDHIILEMIARNGD
jgi:hypothetical protein